MWATMTFQLMINMCQVAAQINDLLTGGSRNRLANSNLKRVKTGLSLEITRRIFYFGY